MEIYDKYLKIRMSALKPKRNDVVMYLLLVNILFTFVLLFKTNVPKVAGVIPNGSPSVEIGLLSSNITDVQKSLSILKTEVGKPKGNLDMKQVESSLSRLSQKINQIASENEMKIKAYINQSNAEINTRLGSISQRVASINNKDSAKYLSVDKLPFAVLAIDNVQEQGVVDVSYSYKNIPLEKGDVLAGWYVKKIDYGHQQALFENKEHMLIKVSLNRGEG